MLEKPIWQMTGREFQNLLKFSLDDMEAMPSRTLLNGAKALAEYLECSESTIFMLRRSGVLDEAVVSHVGKKIVFDGEKARELAEDYRKQQRDNKK